MDTALWIEIIRILPGILQLFFIVAVLGIFYKPVSDDLIPRLKWLKMFGLEASFQDAFHQAAMQQTGKITELDKAKLIKRAKRAASMLSGGRVLWLDERLSAYSPEIRILFSLGIRVDTADNPQDALNLLKRHRYHGCVLVARPDGFAVAMAKRMAASSAKALPVILYGDAPVSGKTPDPVFGATHRLDHLIHFIIDVVEREK